MATHTKKEEWKLNEVCEIMCFRWQRMIRTKYYMQWTHTKSIVLDVFVHVCVCVCVCADIGISFYMEHP